MELSDSNFPVRTRVLPAGAEKIRSAAGAIARVFPRPRHGTTIRARRAIITKMIIVGPNHPIDRYDVPCQLVSRLDCTPSTHGTDARKFNEKSKNSQGYVCVSTPFRCLSILLPWPKKLRQARKPNMGACMLDRSRACAAVPRARGCLNFFGQGRSMNQTHTVARHTGPGDLTVTPRTRSKLMTPTIFSGSQGPFDDDS